MGQSSFDTADEVMGVFRIRYSNNAKKKEDEELVISNLQTVLSMMEGKLGTM